MASMPFEDRTCVSERGVDRASWLRLAEQGLFKLFSVDAIDAIPERLDRSLEILDSLGRNRRLGLAFSAGAHLFAVMSVLRKFGTKAQCEQWLGGLGDGQLIGAIAMAEPQGSSDAFSMKTAARRVDGGYEITGHKTYITNACICNVSLVFARDFESNKVICALVKKGQAGFEVGPAIETMGLRDSDLGEFHLADCRVEDDAVIATGQRAKWAFMHAMEWERGLILAPLAGLMHLQITECLRWAHERRQGNGTLYDLQAVRHRLADMQKRHHIVKAVLHNFVQLKKQGKNAFGDASLVKMIVSDAFLENSMDAMKLQGAHGFTMASMAQQDLRDAMAFQMASGSTDIQKNIAVEWLSRGYA